MGVRVITLPVLLQTASKRYLISAQVRRGTGREGVEAYRRPAGDGGGRGFLPHRCGFRLGPYRGRRWRWARRARRMRPRRAGCVTAAPIPAPTPHPPATSTHVVVSGGHGRGPSPPCAAPTIAVPALRRRLHIKTCSGRCEQHSNESPKSDHVRKGKDEGYCEIAGAGTGFTARWAVPRRVTRGRLPVPSTPRAYRPPRYGRGRPRGALRHGVAGAQASRATRTVPVLPTASADSSDARRQGRGRR
jgi:hypothetical protein